MELLTDKVEASFYCNRCDKWVDGIEDPENQSHLPGVKQVLCDECGSAILVSLPGFWNNLRRRASQFLARTFSARQHQ